MFLGETQHLSGNNGALWWSILVDNQAHNEQKPIASLSSFAVFELTFVFS